MLNDKIIVSKGVVDDFAQFGTLFGLDFETDEIKIKAEDFADFDDIVWANELVGIVDNHAEFGIFTNGFGVENVLTAGNEGAGEFESDDFEGVGVDDWFGDKANRCAGLDAENGSIK